jgi:dihydroflavonol-4-reductase
MRVFLTGGTGFIGQPLTKSLLRRGWEVTALVRKPESLQAQALRKQRAVLAKGDVTERESMRSGMSGADIVVHNAGLYELGLDDAGIRRAQQINVQGTENTLGLAYELGIKRTVYVSTTWAYGASGPTSLDEAFQRQAPYYTAYERTKAEAHEIARQYQQRGLPLAIVCPNGVMGINDHSVVGYFLRLYVNRLMPPMVWSPNSIVSFVEVNDLAEGVALASEKGRMGETYFLCGEPKSLKEHFAYWNEKPGGFKSRIWMPARLMEFMFWPLEPLQRAIGFPAFMSRETVYVASCNLNYSSEKAQRELGWTHRSARDMWHGIIDGEIALLAKRRHQGLLARFKPLVDEDR